MPLTKRTLKDGAGQPIKADTIYTPLIPFAGDLENGHSSVWNPGKTRLRGDHAVVQKWPQRFVPVDLDSVTLGRLTAAVLYPNTEPPKARPKPAIPPEREAIASETFWSGNDFVTKGAVRDDRSEIVRCNPRLFHRRPRPLTDEAAPQPDASLLTGRMTDESGGASAPPRSKS